MRPSNKIQIIWWGGLTQMPFVQADFERQIRQNPEELLAMGKKVWNRTPFKRPVWVLDRMVPAEPRPGSAPKTRLLMVTGTVTSDIHPGVSFDATKLRWSVGKWSKHGPTITNARRIGAVWDQQPSLPAWIEMRNRLRLAAQLGHWINPPLPEDL